MGLKREESMNNENLQDISKRDDFKELSAKGGSNGKGMNVKTALKRLLSNLDVDGEWANPVVKKLIQKALKDGDLRAIVEIIDRIEGKVIDKSVQIPIDDKKITIVYHPNYKKPDDERLKKYQSDDGYKSLQKV